MRVFVTDANDEAPEFQNLPFIVDVSEVQDVIILPYIQYDTLYVKDVKILTTYQLP